MTVMEQPMAGRTNQPAKGKSNKGRPYRHKHYIVISPKALRRITIFTSVVAVALLAVGGVCIYHIFA